jgi:putative aldouronate transport system substrate-binding protein
MRWLNELYDERLALEIARGPLGVTLSERPDGSIEFLPSPKGMSWEEFRFRNAPFEAFPGLELQEMYARMRLPEVQKRKLEVSYPLYRPYFPKEVYPKVLFTPEQEKRLTVLRTDIHLYVERNTARWIAGDQTLTDATWNAYQEQLQRMGLEELLAIYQQTYDRVRGSR